MNIYVILLLIPIAFLLAFVSMLIKKYFFNDNDKRSYVHSNITTEYHSPQNNHISSAVNDLKNLANDLKILGEGSNFLISSSEKKNLTRVLNRISQGLFRFLNGELKQYKKEDVALLFEEIQEIFISVNHKLIIPRENDFFDQNSMIARDFKHSDNPELIDKVFRTTILGIKEISRGEVIKKAEVILYKKDK